MVTTFYDKFGIEPFEAKIENIELGAHLRVMSENTIKQIMDQCEEKRDLVLARS